MPTNKKLECVDPTATVVKCAVCGKDVYTCERTDIPIDANYPDYRCPVHPDGCEISGGGWVCSEECFEVATKRLE